MRAWHGVGHFKGSRTAISPGVLKKKLKIILINRNKIYSNNFLLVILEMYVNSYEDLGNVMDIES